MHQLHSPALQARLRGWCALLSASVLVVGCSTAPTTGPLGGGSQGASEPPSSAQATEAPSARPRPTVPPPPTAWNPKLKIQAFDPVGLLSAFGSIWIGEHHGGKLLRVDPRTGKVIAEVSNLGGGAQLLFAGFGRVWVPTATQLEAIDPATNKVVKDFAGSFSYDGVVADGHIWIGNHADKLLEIDPTTGATLATIASGGPGQQYGENCLNSVSFGAGAVWWSVNDLEAVYEVDPASASVKSRILNVGASFVAGTADRAWAKSNDGVLRTLDATSGSVASTASIEDPAPDQCGGAVAIDGSTLWIVGDGNYSSIYRYDVASSKVTGLFDPGDVDLQDVAVDANHSVWLNFYDSGFVNRYDLPAP